MVLWSWIVGCHLFLFSINSNRITDEPKYHQVSAGQGDGILSLLRKYKLDAYDCNLQQFCKLNQLRLNEPLVKGKKYYIPILLYTYDGKTIRSTLGISDWNKAIRIRDYNDELYRLKLRQSSYIDSKILWVPYHELYCGSVTTPLTKDTLNKTNPVSSTNKTDTLVTKKPPLISDLNASKLEPTNKAEIEARTFPIFGKDFAYTPLESNKLKGKVFYIVSGHGGPDPGAIGSIGSKKLCEDEYAYDVSLRLYRNLIAHGATAYMITRDPNDGIRGGDMLLDCDKDEENYDGSSMVLNQKARLTQRVQIINALYEENRKKGLTDQLFLEIHVDSRSNSQQIDLFFYHHSNSKVGKQIATQLHNVIKNKYARHRQSGEYHGTVSARDLFMIRECKPPTVYVELGNILHYQDQKRIILENNRQALANWLLEGLMQ